MRIPELRIAVEIQWGWKGEFVPALERPRRLYLEIL
jgi:hypothetical protein